MVPGESVKVEALLERARVGDASAAEELLARCRSYLATVARAQVETWLQAKVDASDIVQQTLLEAHRGFRQFQGTSEAEWLSWLRRILARNAADFVRQYRGTAKRQVGREVSLAAKAGTSSVLQFEPAGAEETPSAQLIRRERQLELAAALDRLSHDYREVIMLRNLQRLPFDEVARRMGRSRPAAQMLWMRAIHKLQQSIRSED
jgi:RNA polymerase sigma-70 factor (ECF subfamily)